MTIHALVLALFAAIHPGADRAAEPAVVDAIASATRDPAELALLVEFAWRESEAKEDPAPRSHDARDLTSCGYLQEPCGFVRTHSLVAQSRYWLRLYREGQRICPAEPLAPLSGGCRRAAKLAHRRQREAAVAMRDAEVALAREASVGVAEAQP
jgi:hypothetical protein